jgi:hypothetical protein
MHIRQNLITVYTVKKEKKIFLCKDIQKGSGAKLYMRKGFLIYEEMCKYLVIYEEAVSHIGLCTRSLLNFLIYEEFFFNSVMLKIILLSLPVVLVLSEYAPMAIYVRCIVINHINTASMYFSICRGRKAELEVTTQNITKKCNCELNGADFCSKKGEKNVKLNTTNL